MPEEVSANCHISGGTASMIQMREELTGIVGGGTYVNYLDASMPNWAQACYGDNLTRLRQVAQRYDPDRLFSFPKPSPGRDPWPTLR